jgi:hypothetical protein
MLTYAAVVGGIEQIIRNVMRPHRMLTYAICMLTYAHAYVSYVYAYVCYVYADVCAC